MPQHSFGIRARTRHLFKKDFRRHGRPSFSTYATIYKVGDYVDIVANAGVQAGMPHKHYQGRTGIIWNVTPRAVGVIINKRVRTRVMRKKICVRIEHVRKSQCQVEYLARKKHNMEVRKSGKGKVIKRQPGWPKLGYRANVKGAAVELGPKKFNFTELFDY
eukprot:NODE_3032_length_607_cov_645.041219_g2534_i0.p1 GENE.NODE_3032_length_607_cov_645.041219_g2534_i0~~NODE_3032_length_607_cov_645.041219_g2534_i0.p1  ORF type:complete len:179 (-),score=44.23 NODE_3032_length_607_cov_645.041219_g2534_i0:71-553(-)